MTNPLSNPLGTADKTLADIAIGYALAQLGKPYLWGGVGPNAYDCSGLTSKAYAAAGVTIPRTAAMQMRTGKSVPNIESALPGDLIFPYVNGSHVTMYLGNGQQVEAPTAGKNVQVSRIYKTAGGIKRIVEGGGTAVNVAGTNPPPGGGAAPGLPTTIGEIMNVMDTLSNPKKWGSLALIGIGVAFIGISFIPMVKDAVT